MRGFTLIELIVVIVIIGILSAVAAPRFVDLSGEANQASVSAHAAALSSASSMNYGQYIASAGVKGIVVKGNTVATVCDVLTPMLQTALPSGFSLALTSACVSQSATCTLTGPNAKTAVVIVTCTE